MHDKINTLDLCSIPIEKIGEAFNTGRITIAVIGTGHIGLILACHFAQANANVLGVDVNADIVNKISRGKSPFFEFKSEKLIGDNVASGRLKATTNLSTALSKANVVVISVPTPLNKKYRPDLTYIKKAVKEVGKRLRQGSAVVIASTVCIGATRNVILPMLERHSALKAGKDFLLACVPQRIDPGNEAHRLDNTPLNVGGINRRSADVVAALFERIVNAEVKKVSTVEIAEASKLVENTYRDVNIALVNELSVFFGKHGVDTAEVIDACSTKWSFHAHFPGPGVGGPCIPTSPHYLLQNATSSELRMVRLARKINDDMPEHVVDLVVKGLKEIISPKSIRKPKIAILGLTYKKDVGDARDTPAERVIKKLEQSPFDISVHDPVLPPSIPEFSRRNLTLEEAAKDADCLIFLTDHTAFERSITRLAKVVHDPCLLVDTKQIFRHFDFSKTRFHYQRI